MLFLTGMQGLGMTCMYCGDGINDLVALAAADVGLAVGSSHASAAASISDRHSSIHGTSSDIAIDTCWVVIRDLHDKADDLTNKLLHSKCQAPGFLSLNLQVWC